MMNSTMVADPLRLSTVRRLSDVAAAVIVAHSTGRVSSPIPPIKVLASAQASDTITLHDRRDISTLMPQSRRARKRSGWQNLRTKDIDMVEVTTASR